MTCATKPPPRGSATDATPPTLSTPPIARPRSPDGATSGSSDGDIGTLPGHSDHAQAERCNPVIDGERNDQCLNRDHYQSADDNNQPFGVIGSTSQRSDSPYMPMTCAATPKKSPLRSLMLGTSLLETAVNRVLRGHSARIGVNEVPIRFMT